MDRMEMVKVDTELGETSASVHRLEQQLAHAIEDLHHYARDKRKYYSKSYQPWERSDEDVEQDVRTQLDTDTVSLMHGRSNVEHTLQRLDSCRALLVTFRAEVERLDQIWLDNGMWSRFFLVPGGHIHSSTNCHSLHPTTQIGWLPELSGLTEKDAVAAYGAILCTHCFPSAPVEWTNQYELEAQAKQAAKCKGSGTWNYDRDAKTTRTGYVYGNGAVCLDCGNWTSTTSTGKLRGHKPEKKD